jgi:hypothetical protein
MACTPPTWLKPADKITSVITPGQAKAVGSSVGAILSQAIPLDRVWDLLSVWWGNQIPTGSGSAHNWTPQILLATQQWTHQVTASGKKPRWYEQRFVPENAPGTEDCLYARAYTALGDFVVDWMANFLPKGGGPSKPQAAANNSGDFALAGWLFANTPPSDRSWIAELYRVGYPRAVRAGDSRGAYQRLYMIDLLGMTAPSPYAADTPLTAQQKTELRAYQAAVGIAATGSLDGTTLAKLARQQVPSATIRQSSTGTLATGSTRTNGTPKKGGGLGKVLVALGIVLAATSD